MRTLFGSLKNTSKIGQNYTDMDGNPGRNLIDFFIVEVCHDCEGRIPMIDGLSVKKSNLLCENELNSKNLIKTFKGETYYFIIDLFTTNFLKLMN